VVTMQFGPAAATAVGVGLTSTSPLHPNINL